MEVNAGVVFWSGEPGKGDQRRGTHKMSSFLAQMFEIVTASKDSKAKNQKFLESLLITPQKYINCTNMGMKSSEHIILTQQFF